MLCAISGEAPQNPVVSAKSGNLFEKRLIEAYVSENGKDPVNGEDLTSDDLIDLQLPRVVRPRPPTLTSIPSLLSVFQNEWDALALETFTLRQHLTQTRQELSSALYENDAARRVIARLSRERDEARDALSKVGVSAAAISNGAGAMQVDSQELSGALVAKVEETHQRLSKTRRKRPVPNDWATTEDVEAFKSSQTLDALSSRAKAMAVDSGGEKILLGGEDGQVSIWSTSEGKVVESFAVRASVADVLWAGDVAVVATTAGTVEGYEAGTKTFSFSSHTGQVTAIALHPCGDLLASVGKDKNIFFYDLASGAQALQIPTDSPLTTAEFHPDGHLFAAGGSDGKIKVYDVKTGQSAATLDETNSLQALNFSENGTWLAAVVEDSTSVAIWDLRKPAQIKVIEMGGPVLDIRWDYTGQFLATAGPSGVTVQQYSKSSKEWSAPMSNATPAVAVKWGTKAKELFVVSKDGTLSIFD